MKRFSVLDTALIVLANKDFLFFVTMRESFFNCSGVKFHLNSDLGFL